MALDPHGLTKSQLLENLSQLRRTEGSSDATFSIASHIVDIASFWRAENRSPH